MENKINLREEFIRLGAKTKFLPKLLEKDYHLTRILHKIIDKGIKDIIFKGGTCLNKCYLGFYRLSEDLDFVYNQDVKNLTKVKIKIIIDDLRRRLFEVLNELGLKTNKNLGQGWKMLTAVEDPKIIGLEIITNFDSLIDNSVQIIKLEISFRKKLINPTRIKAIKHEFIDALGQPILKENIEIEVIDLSENFAEKFRALVLRKNMAIRDIYDIFFIIKNKIINMSPKLIELILIKINENSNKKFEKKDLIEFINNLKYKISDIEDKEILSLLRSDEKVNIEEIILTIISEFKDEKTNI